MGIPQCAFFQWFLAKSTAKLALKQRGLAKDGQINGDFRQVSAGFRSHYVVVAQRRAFRAHLESALLSVSFNGSHKHQHAAVETFHKWKINSRRIDGDSLSD